MTDAPPTWHKAADLDELPEGRVKTVTMGTVSIALTHVKGEYGALDNKCPHQGGPLGEGTIEGCYLRCPWHGWDFDPITGKPPGGYDDGVATYPVEVRDDGVYVGLSADQAHVRTVTDVMAETMVNWGVTHVFGMVGHSNLGLADALRRQEAQGNLTYIGIRHEGAAAFAASAYGKLTSKPAACLTIAGPGATNLYTGLWDAKVDRAPILALTGQVDTQVLGPGAFQEIDLGEAFAAVATFSQPVHSHSKHAELMSLAVKNALVERNVAHLVFPDDVQTEPAPDAPAGSPDGRMGQVGIAPPQQALDEAVAKMEAAKRPLIVVGHGARHDMAQIIALAEQLCCGVVTTFKAKGQISDHHPLGCGVIGRSGTPVASWMMNECDLMIVFGASFSNHTGLTDKKPTIQVDFDRMALGKFHAVDVPLWGEIGVTAELMTAGVTSQQANDQRGEIAERWALWRSEKASRRADDRGNGVNSAHVFELMSQLVDQDAAIAVDVGNNTYSFGRYFECRQQSVVMSGYLGSIGFAFPAAMGLRMAAPERQTVSVSGDGGFGQYMVELLTAVKYEMNITHVLLNNSELGKISKEQRAGNWDVWATSLHNPDFARYANDCGALGIRVTAADEVEAALKEALAYDGPALVEVISDADLI